MHIPKIIAGYKYAKTYYQREKVTNTMTSTDLAEP